MRLNRLLKQLNWKVYLMELFIVILGISIAYQLNIVYENGVNRKLELAAIENLKKENEINIAEFKSLENYRKRITDRSERLMTILRSGELEKDSVEAQLFWLVQTSTPDLQQEATNFYLNSNYSNLNLRLKNELLTLKTYLQELMDMSTGYSERKTRDFMYLLRDVVDFDAREIKRLEKIRSLEFKNIIWNQTSDEHELNRLYDQATAKLLEVQELVEEILNEAK